jgi:hypothetical protein
LNSVLLFPNPNSGEFEIQISMPVNNGEFVVYDVLGKAVFRHIVVQGENKITSKHLSKGIYNYSISDNKTTLGKGKLVVE